MHPGLAFEKRNWNLDAGDFHTLTGERHGIYVRPEGVFTGSRSPSPRHDGIPVRLAMSDT